MPDTQSPRAKDRRRAIRWTAYFVLGLLMAVFIESYDQLEFSESSCDAPSADAAPPFYVPIYTAFLNRMHDSGFSQVRVVNIKADLLDIQQNVCLGRQYLADLLTAVATGRPAVIVLDKYFSPDSCASNQASTNALIQAVDSLAVPVVVGESTDIASRRFDESCLVEKPQLDFRKTDLKRGILRLNVNKEQIPTQWPVLPKDPALAKIKSRTRKSLAMIAAAAFAQELGVQGRFRALLDEARQPYARIGPQLPEQSSTDLLCAAGTDAMRKRWSLRCSASQPRLDLAGKLVVIGAENEVDHWIVLGRPIWGFQLQAHYIHALLAGQYLRAPPGSLPILLFLVFLFLLELVPILARWLCRRNGWRLPRFWTHKNEIFWIIGWSLVFVTATLAAFYGLRYLPPLLVLSAVILVLVSRIGFNLLQRGEEHLLPEGEN